MPKTRFVISCSLPQELLEPSAVQNLQIIALGLAHDVKRNTGLDIDIKKTKQEQDCTVSAIIGPYGPPPLNWQQKFCFEVELDSKQWFQYCLQVHNPIAKLTEYFHINLIQRLGLFIL